MTTRAGWTGILGGLLTSLLIYPFFIAQPQAFLRQRLGGLAWLAEGLIALLMLAAGAWAGRWSGSVRPARCALLGGLAGATAGSLLFCLWGAGAAGNARWAFPAAPLLNEEETTAALVRQTLGACLVLGLGGGGLGALGGWLACRRLPRVDVFDKTDPQMALNVSITAVPACVFAAALAAGLSARLAGPVARLPLQLALGLVFLAQLALTLVVPHETAQAEHRCGLDEVKMAAYVGIGAAPALAGLLLAIDPASLHSPLAAGLLLAVAGLSLTCLWMLFRRVLPRRAAFPPAPDERQRAQAKWFGSIARSHGPRLVKLCTGCGMVMLLPLYVSSVALLINLAGWRAGPALNWALFRLQAAVSVGAILVTVAALSAMYLFYLNLGRRFSRRNTHPTA